MTLSASVAICTRNHPDELAACLESLVPIRDRVFEVVVVDNASAGDATRKVALAFGARYVREPVIGLAAARNRAIRTASGEIIAFIDDDCRVETGWLDALAKAFSNPLVGAVTGRAISDMNANWVQRQFNSLARGFCTAEPVEMTPEAVGDIYSRAAVGVGANMAFRRALLVELNGFPCIINRGNSGDDIYMLFSVAGAGYIVRYEPDSLVYEKHRSGLVSTVARMFEYGLGETRILWYLSARDQRFFLFLKNFGWEFFRNGLKPLLFSAIHSRWCHLLFRLASLVGLCAGLFIPWGWRAHICGESPEHGGLA